MAKKKITDEQQTKLFTIITNSLKNGLIDCFEYCINNKIAGDEFGKWFIDYMCATSIFGSQSTLYIAADEFAKKHGLDIENLLSDSSDD